jgi:hypothetical protein
MTIRGTDESKVLRRIARKLDSTILRHIRNKRVLPWNTDRKQIPNQPLETVLEGLMPWSTSQIVGWRGRMLGQGDMGEGFESLFQERGL